MESPVGGWNESIRDAIVECICTNVTAWGTITIGETVENEVKNVAESWFVHLSRLSRAPSRHHRHQFSCATEQKT